MCDGSQNHQQMGWREKRTVGCAWGSCGGCTAGESHCSGGGGSGGYVGMESVANFLEFVPPIVHHPISKKKRLPSILKKINQTLIQINCK